MLRSRSDDGSAPEFHHLDVGDAPASASALLLREMARGQAEVGFPSGFCPTIREVAVAASATRAPVAFLEREEWGFVAQESVSLERLSSLAAALRCLDFDSVEQVPDSLRW